MTPAARLSAAIELLEQIIVAARDGGSAADQIIKNYFGKRRYAGSKDRRAIRELSYRAIRYFTKRPESGRAAFAAMAKHDKEMAKLFGEGGYAPAALSPDEISAAIGALPTWLRRDWYPVYATLDEQKAMLERAPLDIRLVEAGLKEQVADELTILGDFPLMISPERQQKTAYIHDMQVDKKIPNALRLVNGSNVQHGTIYRAGLVEVQDLGSQYITANALFTLQYALQGEGRGRDIYGRITEDGSKADTKPAKATDFAAGDGPFRPLTIVDLCAGAGGKTLMLADNLPAHSRIIASDISRNRLRAFSQRLRRRPRANIELVELNPGQELEILQRLLPDGADFILVDAPCSGTGTWRRNPELRWRLSKKRMLHYQNMQSHLLDVAAALSHASTVISYATCSLAQAEGAMQIDAFQARHPMFRPIFLSGAVGRRQGKGMVLTPFHDGTDGFFYSTLKRE